MLKTLALLAALVCIPSIATADDFQIIGPNGQYTFGSTTNTGGWFIQNGQYNQVWVTPSYGYNAPNYGYSRPSYAPAYRYTPRYSYGYNYNRHYGW